MKRAVWAGIAILTLIGVFAASQRLFIVYTRVIGPAEQRYALTRIEQRNVETLAVVTGVGLTPEFDAFVRRLGDRWTKPGYATLHLVPGILMLLLMPLQLSRRIRSRHITLHRWSGRTILVLGVGIIISSVWFGILDPQVAVIEAPTIAVFTTLFAYCATRGYLAIRRRDVTAHREWMIRTYAVTIAIATVRLVSLPLTWLFPRGDSGVMLITSFWLGWLLTLAAAELWIRRTRAPSRSTALKPASV